MNKIAGRIGLTIGGGSAGLLGAVTAFYSPHTAMIAGAAIITAVVANAVAKAVESIYQRRSDIIKARGEARAARIAAESEAVARLVEANSEAKALILRATTRTELLVAGTCSDKPEQVAEMLRQQSLDANLPKGRRLDNKTLASLLAAGQISKTDTEPDSGPKGVHRKPDGDSGCVVPIRQDEKPQ